MLLGKPAAVARVKQDVKMPNRSAKIRNVGVEPQEKAYQRIDKAKKLTVLSESAKAD